MAFTESQQAQIKDALGKKLAGGCPICGQFARQLIPDLFAFPAQRPSSYQKPSLQTLIATGQFVPYSWPCILVACGNCGFSEFYNVHLLGLQNILNMPDPPEGASSGT
jgi:hypothetical protein